MNFEALEERQLLATDLAFSFFDDVLSGSSEDRAFDTGTVASAPGINLPLFHKGYNLDGSGYAVAVIDSGIDYRHPALGGSFGKPNSTVVAGYDFVDGRSGGFVEGDSTPGPDGDPMDATGHGTSVAGIIASNDDVYPGIAPGVDLVSLRVLDANGQGKWSWVANALQWVIDNHEQYNIVAVNMSLGDGNLQSTPSARLEDVEPKLKTLYDLGITLVASAGNDFYTYNSTPGLQYPAVSNHVISVGATYGANEGARTWPSGARDLSSATDRIAAFTQRSSKLDLLAPGAIVTTTHLSNGGQERYLGYAGSSQAAPFVTAAAVLVHQALDITGQSSLATPAYIRNLLRSTGVQVNDGDDENDNVTNTGLNFPRLNLEAAIQTVMANAPSNAPGPDIFEDNSTQDKSAFLGWIQEKTYSNLSWHTKTDTDWYSFIFNNDSTFKITVDPEHGSAPAFVLHDVTNGRSRTYTATVHNGVATLDVQLRANVRYFLEVRAPNTTSRYDLKIDDVGTPHNNAGQVNTPQSAPLNLAPDRFESNNNQEQPTFLGFVRTAQFKRLNLHNSGDVDWFRFLSLEKGGRRIEVEATNPANAAVKFTLIDQSSGTTKTLSSRMENGVAVLETSFDVLNYLIKVESVNGLPLEYDLRIGPVMDRVEPNGVSTKAYFLGNVQSQSEIDFSIHTPTDVDWIRFQATDDLYRIEVFGKDGQSIPQFTFHDVTKGKERDIDSENIAGVATVDVLLRSKVNYFLEIHGSNGDIFDYRVKFSRLQPPSQSGDLVDDEDDTELLDIFFSSLQIDIV